MADIWLWIERIGAGVASLLLLGVLLIGVPALFKWLGRQFLRLLRLGWGLLSALFAPGHDPGPVSGLRGSALGPGGNAAATTPPLAGLPRSVVDSRGELSLHGIWVLAQAVHGFCEGQRYPLWRFTHENHDEPAIAAWHASFRSALREWADVRVWVEEFEASWGSVSRPWLSEAEYLCSQRLTSRPFRHPWTLELKGSASGGDPGKHGPVPMRLADLLQTRHGVDGLIHRLDRKCVASYEAIDLPPLADETARNRRLWTMENGEIHPLALAWPDLSGFRDDPAVPSPVLLPRDWGAVGKRWGALGPLHLQGHALIRVHDASGRAGVVHLMDMDDTLLGKVVGYWVQPCQWHYLHGGSSAEPVYEAAQTLAPDAQGEVVCDLLDVLTGARLNPAGIKVLAGTLGHDCCIAINEAGASAVSRRLDLMSLAGRVMHGPPDAGRAAPGHAGTPEDLRWSKLFASTEGLRPVQSPLSGQWGYIDDTGAVVIEPQFARAWFFSADRAEASPAIAPGLSGLIDRQGQWAIPPRWRCIHPQNRRQFVVQDADDQWGAVDEQGTQVVALRPRAVWLQDPWIAAKLADEMALRQTTAAWSKDVAALKEEALIEGIARQWHERMRQWVQAALHTPPYSLAALEGLFDRDARQRDLGLAGVWGMHVRLIADQDGGILAPRAGETGWISTQYPVGLSCFDLSVQAPVCGMATRPEAVIGVLWRNLEAVHGVPEEVGDGPRP